jgi:N-acetyl-alpha-D-muramate 1-phosphate uridylyltransferase
MIKKAMILAAGFGKRINPLTLQTPKPLLKIGDETLLSNTIKFLKLFGVNQAVVNVHHLGDKIIDYIENNNFNFSIKIIKEKDKILDTGGGVLNAINYFSEEPFIIINPDTIWNSYYLKELKLLEKLLYENEKNKCCLLVVDKEKSFDKHFKGDFNLKKSLINRNPFEEPNYIYTGVQIIKPEVFLNLDSKIFSINNIWDKLIKNDQLHGVESKNVFYHVSTLDIYNTLLKKDFKY